MATAKSTPSPVVDKNVGSAKDIHQKIMAVSLPARAEQLEKSFP